MRYIESNHITAGMTIATPLYNSKGRMLLAANTRITASMARRIQALGFPGIFILDDGDKTFEPLLDDAIRIEAVKSLKKLDLDQVMFVANAVVNQVLYASNAVYDMDSVCDYDTLTYMHSVNVALLSTMMGVSMVLDNKSLELLAQAALLHDIGKTRVSSHIIKGTHRLSDDERREIQKHPDYAYEMLRKTGMVPDTVMDAVRYHHENEDGTGYPCRLASQDIPLFAKIIHVADVYDALVSRRSYKKAMNPADALENLMANIGSMFDLSCVEALRDNIALYPIGSHVRLSNGVTAWVQENRRGYPTRPLLRTRTGISIDLMKNLNLVITGFTDDCSACLAMTA